MRIPPQNLEFTAARLWSRARSRTTSLLLLIVALASTAQLGAQAAAPVTLVKAGRLFDPRSGHALAPAEALQFLPYCLVPTLLVPFYLITHAIVAAQLAATRAAPALSHA
jgi:hypothetical protein